jgi:hypothetical protein
MQLIANDSLKIYWNEEDINADTSRWCSVNSIGRA